MKIRKYDRLLCGLLLIGLLPAFPAFSQETTEPAKAKVEVEVEIVGLEGETRGNVENALSIRGTPPSDLPVDNWARRHHARAPGQIREALQPFGYYAPQIKSTLHQADNKWKARYEIAPGAQVKLRKVDIRLIGPGEKDTKFLEAHKQINLKSGEPLNHAHYETAKNILQEVALRYGYLDARFSENILRVNSKALWADVVLHYETGERYRLGRVDIEQDILNPDFIQRYVPFTPGTAYDRQLLVELESALIDSNYFSDVSIDIDREEAVEFVVPVDVSTTPRKPQLYSLGLGYGTDTGPRLNLGFEWRRVNRKGHRAGANLTLSEVKESISTRYQIPISDVTRDTLTFGATSLEEDAGDGITEDRELGITHTTSWRKWRRSTYLTLGQNVSHIGTDTQRFDLVIPGATLTRTRSDNPIYPRRSYGISVDLHGAHENLLSDTSFLQGRLLTRLTRPLDEKSRLLLRGELGVTDIDDTDDLPLSQRFFAGGDQSVRGYRYQSLGDVNTAGDVIGGRYLLAGSIEVDRLVWNDWGVAAFVDTGNASDEADMDLLTGAGLGLRWRSPIGLVRLDVATPLDDAPDGDTSSVRLHFGIGVEL